MKIRSITYFLNPNWPLDEKKLRQAGQFLSEAREAFESAGYEVQTARIATVSFPHLLGEKKINDLPKLAQALEAVLPSTGAAYASLGPALIEAPESYAVIPDAIAATDKIFFSGEMASVQKGLSLSSILACAKVITRCAPITPDGFANLRFAALANVPAGAPFFPAAYHEGEQTAFSLATEAADLAVDSFSQATSVEGGRNALVHLLEDNARKLVKAAEFLKYKFNIRFGGIDFSLAPFPRDAQSLGTAMEKLGVPAVGLHGSLAAAAILTEAIDRANFPRCGFSGLMLHVLEDSILAQRAADGTLTIKDLLLYSTVCGTGLDTVPLPGNVTAEQLAPLLFDLSALATRLNKPLTARLMPIPGKQAGDATNFNFEYFANSKVMALDSKELKKAFTKGGTFSVKAR